MNPMTDPQIRRAFVNASRREVKQAVLPDLAALDWDTLDYLGWRDPKRPLSGYVVLELDGNPTGVLLRAAAPSSRRPAVCAWCQDVVETDDVSLYAARRSGAAGRRGNTIGTLICTAFDCSRNVRRTPTLSEVFSTDEADKAQFVQRRISGLRERSERFVRQVLTDPDAA